MPWAKGDNSFQPFGGSDIRTKSMRVCESEAWLARWNLPILHNFFWITLIIHTNCVITILKALFLTTETKKSTFYLESSYMYCYNVCSPSYRLNTQKTWLKTTITVARVIFISENFDKYLLPFLRIEIVKKLYFIMTIF